MAGLHGIVSQCDVPVPLLKLVYLISFGVFGVSDFRMK